MSTTTTETKPLLAWHFLPATGRTRYSDELVTLGGTLTATGALKLCENGMHASVRASDALRYAPGWTICRVELSGEILVGDDKVCARHRKVIAMADAKRALLHHAADCAERALLRIKSPDPRSVQAIEAARAYADAKIDGAKLQDFRVAAWNARNELWQLYRKSAAADAAAYAAAYAAAAADAAADAYNAAAAHKASAEKARREEREWQENALSKRLLEVLGLPTT